jgi:hypothetical protein
VVDLGFCVAAALEDVAVELSLELGAVARDNANAAVAQVDSRVPDREPFSICLALKNGGSSSVGGAGCRVD